MSENQSKVINCTNYQWKGIPVKEYKKDEGNCYKGVKRIALLGEKDDEQQLNFQMPYFEIEAGGYTSFEFHRHPHSVVVIRGCESVVLANEVQSLGLHDMIYISPETVHQFHADKCELLGFLCIVDRYRDCPVLPDNDQFKTLITSARVKG